MSSHARQRGKIHDSLVWLIMIVVLLTPFILGGNRPVAWAFTAMMLSATAAYYIFRITFAQTAPRAGAANFPFLFAYYWIMLGWMVVQTLPMAALFPDNLIWLPASMQRPSTISIAPVETFFSIVRWVSAGLACYLAMVVSVNSPRSVSVLKMLFVVVVIHAIYALLALLEFGDTILFVQKWAYAGSATGAFVNRNSFATFLAVGSIVGLCIVMNAWSALFAQPRRSRFLDVLNVQNGVILPFAGFILVVVTLLATNSRMGVFAAAAGLATAAILYSAKTEKPAMKAGRFVLPVASLATIGIIGWLYGGKLFDRLGATESAADERVQLYNQVLNMISWRPVTGYGGGSFEYAFPLFHHAPVSFDFVWDKAHSTYLGLWSDYGLVFGSIPVLIILIGFFRIAAAYAASQRPDPVTIAALGCVVAVALHSLVDFSMEIQGVTLLFVVVFGAGLGRAAREGS